MILWFPIKKATQLSLFDRMNQPVKQVLVHEKTGKTHMQGYHVAQEPKPTPKPVKENKGEIDYKNLDFQIAEVLRSHKKGGKSDKQMQELYELFTENHVKNLDKDYFLTDDLGFVTSNYPVEDKRVIDGHREVWYQWVERKFNDKEYDQIANNIDIMDHTGLYHIEDLLQRESKPHFQQRHNKKYDPRNFNQQEYDRDNEYFKKIEKLDSAIHNRKFKYQDAVEKKKINDEIKKRIELEEKRKRRLEGKYYINKESPQRKASDSRFGDEIDVSAVFIKNTEEAFEHIGPAAEDPMCVRCGHPIKYCFLTEHGVIGGDCLATLTGDNSTRQYSKKIVETLKRMGDFTKGHIVLELTRKEHPLAPEHYLYEAKLRNSYGRTKYLGTAEGEPQKAMMLSAIENYTGDAFPIETYGENNQLIETISDKELS